MLGFALSWYLPTYFHIPDRPFLTFLYWLFSLLIKGQITRTLTIVVRVLGFELAITYQTPTWIAEQRRADATQGSQMADFAKELAEKLENMEKMRENAAKTAENGPKTAENSEKTSENVYIPVERDENGIITIDIRSKTMREVLAGDNLEWALTQVALGAQLVVDRQDSLNVLDKSFTLPGYDRAEDIGIGSVVIFGDKDDYIRAQVTGYAQSPEGDRTFYYKVA